MHLLDVLDQRRIPYPRLLRVHPRIVRYEAVGAVLLPRTAAALSVRGHVARPLGPSRCLPRVKGPVSLWRVLFRDLGCATGLHRAYDPRVIILERATTWGAFGFSNFRQVVTWKQQLHLSITMDADRWIAE